MSTNTAGERLDLRVRRTHKLLWEALLAELAERSFEAITVSAICARAMVHRTTFYKHYADKYDLLEKGMQGVYASLIGTSEHLPPSAYSAEHPPPYFTRLFEHAAERERFYRLMLVGEGVPRFQKLLRDAILAVASSGGHDGPRAGEGPDVPLSLHAQLMAGAAVSALAWWLEHGRPYTPRQMAGFLVSPDRAFS